MQTLRCAGLGWSPSSSAGVYKTTDGGSTWTQQNVYGPSTTQYGPGAIHFFDASHGVVLGSWLPETYTTSDGGVHWNQASVPSVYPWEVWQSDLVVAGNYVWTVTTGERVFRSTNRGITWSASALESQYSNDFPAIDFRIRVPGYLPEVAGIPRPSHLPKDDGRGSNLEKNPTLPILSSTTYIKRLN